MVEPSASHRPNRAIVHIDADAFFVSCEVATNPSLRGKPVAVGGLRRGIVASASYEARRLGVYTPMPMYKAVKICPQLVVLPGSYPKYEAFSRKMFDLLRDLTPIVEEDSIDEGYGDLSGLRAMSPTAAAIRLRSSVRETLGLSVSVGLGTSKLVSSVASKLNKPDHFLEVVPGSERDFLSPLPASWLPGVGPKMEAELNAIGIKTISDIAASSPEILRSIVGSLSQRLVDFAIGIDDRPVVPDRPASQSYGKQETFGRDTGDKAEVRRVLRCMADDLMSRVRADAKMIRSVEVRVRRPDMSQSLRSESLPEPTDLETDVYEAIDNQLDRAWSRPGPLRLVGLKFSGVYERTHPRQGELDLQGPARRSRRILASVMDELRSRYGASSMLRGHQLRDPGDTPREPSVHH